MRLGIAVGAVFPFMMGLLAQSARVGLGMYRVMAAIWVCCRGPLRGGGSAEIDVGDAVCGSSL